MMCSPRRPYRPKGATAVCLCLPELRYRSGPAYVGCSTAVPAVTRK
ncbi:hypothetical protein RB1254 [Rhodopirellula baltica SH 1]|uniref:Uncharacterized protein n=1 Tax=Rhodopirellula baltica (strain DSM 10527 / NCIMB 13988 / SH1) TaxID=243090 RepID=Q7UXL6_RHOBA|nr:hypothetical protein RB1254 [Rhodopirellula baltica SH 1]